MSDPTILVAGLFTAIFLAYKFGRKDKYFLLHTILFGTAMLIMLWQSLATETLNPLVENIMFVWIAAFLPLLVWFKKARNIA
ncbi:hypothetical protein [Ammoniphilus sp. 3BR4]|uniref:hypothetical protein n=1 Tax=Ammoniphilus sp. 3BR4 TaxID=3158265 RepID=UPI0034654D30